MTVFEDFINVNKKAGEKAVESFAKNPLIILTGIVYSLISLLGYYLVYILFRGPLFILGGFVSGFITASLTSNYLYLLFIIINYNRRITMDDFKKGFTVFLRPVYSVLVLFWIAQYFLGVFGVVSPVGAFSVGSIVGLIALLVLNALPETIYQKQYMGIDSLVYSIEFLRDNIINWIVPNLIFYLLIYMLSGRLLLGILPTGIGMSLGFNPIFFLREILGQTVFSFMMIYRGYLYRTLSNSTKRKREFMNKF